MGEFLSRHLVSGGGGKDTERERETKRTRRNNEKSTRRPLFTKTVVFLRVQDIHRAASYYEDLLNDPRIASKSHLRLSTLLYHHAFKYEISFLSSLSVWAAFMSIFYRARLYVFVSKLCFCGSTLALLFLPLLLLLL